MFFFTNKTVLITGGSRGIGASCVQMFAQAGAKVFFTYNTGKKEAEDLCKENANVTALQIDLSIKENLEERINNLVKECGEIDILVNNVGIWNFGDADTMPLEVWEDLMLVNTTSMFLFTKAVLPLMNEKKNGKIINISSTAGQRGEAHHSHYAASKGAMISYTKAIAAELGEFNINVNSVAPGWVITPLNDGVFSDKELVASIEKDIPLKRIATADDIAGPVLFLASEAARHITGEILNVNGGSVLCG